MTIQDTRPTQTPSPTGRRPSLDDRYSDDIDRVYLSGVQALVRLPIDQARLDRRHGLRTGSFITGYPGSPLGGYDLALKQARKLMREFDIIHQPGQNEELAVTALMGTQMLDRYPHSRYDGVTGYWYGKGPGIDRSGDALRHANFAGTSEHGAVVVLSGEDHEAKSSTLPYEQEYAFAHAGIPVLYPSSVPEFLSYGMHAAAMSRYSGCWTAMKLVGQLCDGGQTLNPLRATPDIVLPQLEIDGKPFRKWQDHAFFPGQTIELERHVFTERHRAAVAYSRANGLDRVELSTDDDRVAIVTAGKTFADLQQALTDLGLTSEDLRRGGVRVIKFGTVYPIDAEFLRDAIRGVTDVYVIEEKRATLENAVKAAVCNLVEHPRVWGKTGPDGAALFPEFGFMDSDSLAAILGPILQQLCPERIELTERITALDIIGDRDYEQTTRRTPNYCSGCPHNVSTKVLDDQVAWGAPGCHVFASILPEGRHIDATFQLGGEGVGWIGLSPFTDLKHVVQNQGDGSFFHASQLNIRFAVAAGVDMTFKLLYNGYVANTGAQARVGDKSVAEVAAMLALEGVSKIAVVAKDPAVYRRVQLPPIATVHASGDVDAVLADLAATSGVTVFIYDGVCANEQRRQRKRGNAPKATEFIVINEDVCENCGDCGTASNCQSLHKTDTEFGPKTVVHQSSCNQDTSCVQGDCPSFVTVTSADGIAKPTPPQLDSSELPDVDVPDLHQPFHIYIPGVGGTGVLTLNSLLAWAAMIDGKEAMSYDQTGAAQKWGAVLSSLIIAPAGNRIAANKVGCGKADLYLAVDPMAAADRVNLDRCVPERTAALVNSNLLPTGSMIRDSYTEVALDPMVELIGRHTDTSRSAAIDARSIAEGLFGDYMATNMVALGAAYQAGLLPISAESIEAAIDVNGTAAAQNLQAFRYGRLAHAHPDRVASLIRPPVPSPAQRCAEARAQLPVRQRAQYDAFLRQAEQLPEDLSVRFAIRIAELIGFQSVGYAEQYVRFVLSVFEQEQTRLGPTPPPRVTAAVIDNLYKVMAYKDEYEVARLHLRASREKRVSSMFNGDVTVKYNLHPPALRALGMQRKLQIPARVLDPAFKGLYAMRRLRGTRLDAAGVGKVRRTERELVPWYRSVVSDALTEMKFANHTIVAEIAALPEDIRGYEHIKLDSIERARARATELRSRMAGAIMLPLFTADSTRTAGQQ